jgi:SOS-response transcriptional repressor LexA
MTINELLQQWIIWKSQADGERYTQKKLAIDAGISETALSKISLGKSLNPKQETIQGIARAIGVSVPEFWSGPPTLGNPTIPIRDEHGEQVGEMDMRLIPVLGTIRCGEGVAVDCTGHIEEYIPRYGVTAPNAFGARVKGASMEPDLYDGDYLIIDPDTPFSKFKGGIAVIQLNEHYVVRRVYRQNGVLVLTPSNAAYQPEIADETKVRLFKIVKIVIGQRRLEELC